MKKSVLICVVFAMSVCFLACGENKQEEAIGSVDVESSVNVSTDDSFNTIDDEEPSEDQAEKTFEGFKLYAENIVKDTSGDSANFEIYMDGMEKGYYSLLDTAPTYVNQSEFTLGAAFLTTHYSDDQKGYYLGQTAWDVIEMVYNEEYDQVPDFIETFKQTYEELMGKSLSANMIEAGQYKVGFDIDPGEYVFFAEGSGYFCVSSDANGNDIIQNDNFDYNSIMTVKNGEYLTLSRAYALPIEEVKTLPIDEANMFKVGVHLAPGEYKLIATGSSAYYCIYSDDRQDDIESNDIFDGQAYIKVKSGQYLTLSRCKIDH
ncbi:MAG: hypothetical protein IKR26_02350 [Lachnospiraceae bacterium]|nr:hypothetical protein [Lachnospiraceae bacterium]